MKKITLLLFTFLSLTVLYAQDTCLNAVVVTAGTTSVGMINGDLPNPDCAENAGLNPRTAGEWYAYTPATDVVVNITTDLPQNAGGDTRLHVYTGTCAALTCAGGNDDIDNMNFLSDFTWLATGGVTYYIAWDDQWGAAAFDFVLTEFPFDCGIYDRPYNEVFDDPIQFQGCFLTEDVDGDGLSWISQQDLDLDGDLTPETFATNANGAATTAMKDDWLISPAINLIGGTEYTITSNYNVIGGAPDNASLEAFILDGQSSTANQMATLFSNTGIVSQGMFETLETMAYSEVNTFTPLSSGDYYVAYRSFGPGGSGFILLFDSVLEATLSVDQFDANSFNYSYNKNTDQLTLESSNLPFNSISMHSILGKEVVSRELSHQNEVIDLSNLTDGVYLATISINGNSKTIKVLKH